jgi:hypothetical protein
MAIPAGYTLIGWYNVIVTDLLERAGKLDAANDFWPILNASQKTQVRNAAITTIDTAITRLTALKADIQAL